MNTVLIVRNHTFLVNKTAVLGNSIHGKILAGVYRVTSCGGKCGAAVVSPGAAMVITVRIAKIMICVPVTSCPPAPGCVQAAVSVITDSVEICIFTPAFQELS